MGYVFTPLWAALQICFAMLFLSSFLEIKRRKDEMIWIAVAAWLVTAIYGLCKVQGFHGYLMYLLCCVLILLAVHGEYGPKGLCLLVFAFLIPVVIDMAVLYLTVVRRWMMVNGTYVNRWPQWLDLEEKLYRPLLLKVLPGVFGWICGLLDKLMDVVSGILPKVGAGVAGVLDILTDGLVVFLRKTIYRDARYHGELEEGNALTHVIGVTLNLLEELLNKTIWRHHEHRKDLEHWFVLKYAAFKENATLIGRSLSFGLVLFCLGLCATLVYLLVSTVR